MLQIPLFFYIFLHTSANPNSSFSLWEEQLRRLGIQTFSFFLWFERNEEKRLQGGVVPLGYFLTVYSPNVTAQLSDASTAAIFPL
jgi:hypothetical protein